MRTHYCQNKNSKKGFFREGFLFAVISLMVGFSTQAKPMNSASLEEAVHSESIVVVRYLGFSPTSPTNLSYFMPPTVQYEVIESLKGAVELGTIRVRYSFHDGSPCVEPEGWKFTKDLMPKVGSEWILFLQNKDQNDVYSTYSGDYGRWSSTPENLEKVKGALPD